jgi:hypothetical protein
MLVVNSPKKQNMIGWTHVKQMNEDDIVLVNSNRLYFQLSKLSRSQNKKAEIKILTDNINNIKDEKQMYVPMRVRDVVKCFESGGLQLPLNTFISTSSTKVNTRTRGKRKSKTVVASHGRYKKHTLY